MRKFEIQKLRAKAISDMRGIVNRAEAENRDMNPEEKSEFQKIQDAVAGFESRIAALEAVEGSEVEPVEEVNSRSREVSNIYETKEYRNAWIRAKLMGDVAGADRELRAVNSTVTNGGYVITPTEIVSQVVELAEKLCWVNQFCTKLYTSSPTARIPLLSTDAAPAVYGATEITSVTADSTMAFDKRDLVPHVLAKLIKISNFVTEISNLEQITVKQIARAFAYGKEAKFMTGSGTNEPLGIFTASATGISTGRDVETSSTTDLNVEALFSAKYLISPEYLNANTCWIFHPDTMKKIAQLKDAENRYLLNPGLNGAADSLLGHSIKLSTFAPNTYTAGLYVGCLADLSEYYSVDVTNAVEVQRLDQLYAATHEIGLLGRCFNDGGIANERAFARIVTKAS